MRATIMGAGKIARGFVADLLTRVDAQVTFIDVDERLIEELCSRGCYTLHILAERGESKTISDFGAVVGNTEDALQALINSDLVFVSVGGRNVERVGTEMIGPAIAARSDAARPLNIVVCENRVGAAQALQEAAMSSTAQVAQELRDGRVAFVESTVLRSCIEPSPTQRANDPLSLRVQDFDVLPVDGDTWIPVGIEIPGIEYRHNFSGELRRKIYTYNAINATISFLGWLRGHQWLADAARDQDILSVVTLAQTETNSVMVRKYGHDATQQEEFAQQALRKFSNPFIEDPIVRQIADPARKLSRNDRLVGPAMDALEVGVSPVGLATAIAAALATRVASDPVSQEVADRTNTHGVTATLGYYSQIPADSALVDLVARQVPLVAGLAGTWRTH